ncbi:hypothetical protein ACG3SL_13950 [Sphingomonas sp. CJ20]
MRFGKLGCALASVAVLAMAVPVQAQSRQDRGRGDRGHHGHGHHRGDKDDGVGGLLVGALLVGGLVALTAGENKRRAREAAYHEDYQAPPVDPAAVPAYAPGSPVADIPAPGAAEYDGLYDEEAAQDRCASAAEVEGQNYARLARVTSISEYRWNGRSWVVKGMLELASSYSDTARRSFPFRCALKAGREPVIAIAELGPDA